MYSLRLLRATSRAANLARSSSRLVAIQMNINGTNIASRANNLSMASHQNLANALHHNAIASMTARFYSTGGDQLSKNQIEEKVLQILSNFDRIKENPAKPQVCI
jgi:hypothetical protein